MEVLGENSCDLHGTTMNETKESETDSSQGYFCLICYNSVEEDKKGYTLPCNHSYCRGCLQAYIESYVLAGQTTIKCFHVDNEPNALLKNTVPCNTLIPEENILEVLKESPEYTAKYTRFKFLKSNPNGRECPHCSHLGVGDPQHPITTCPSCDKMFCFVHALAHPLDVPCSDYEKNVSSGDQVRQSLVRSRQLIG